jgi:hypothetical protein
MAKIYEEQLPKELDDITIENLKLGRVTRQALEWACKEVDTELTEYWRLADVLNDMLAAFRKDDRRVRGGRDDKAHNA